MFLKNKSIIFKIRRSKVTDYAALMFSLWCGVDEAYNKMVVYIPTVRKDWKDSIWCMYT